MALEADSSDGLSQVSAQEESSNPVLLAEITQATSANQVNHRLPVGLNDGEEYEQRHHSNTNLPGDTPPFALFRSQWEQTIDAQTQGNLLESQELESQISLANAVQVSDDWVGWLRCQWEIPVVVRDMQESAGLEFMALAEIKACLGNFVTITGSKGTLKCSTCTEYLVQNWGNAGRIVLDRLSEGVAQVLSESPGSSPAETTLRATTTHVTLLVTTEGNQSQSILDAVAWMCAAVRVNPERIGVRAHGTLRVSESVPILHVESAEKPELVVYCIRPLYICSDEDIGVQSICWTDLFTTGIIAIHPTERQWGVGLEISFDMMVHLSAVENTYYVDGGTILRGFFTALVPISYDEASNSIQWHFESVDESSEKLLSPQDLSSIQKDWYKTTDIASLRRCKCFVGWFEHSNIMLGTQQLLGHQHHRLQRSSGTHEHHRSAGREGFELGGQLGFTTGPLNFATTVVNTWRFHSNVQRFRPPTQYIQAIRLAYTKVALVLDSQSKQAWLVPMLSLILHMCHIYLEDTSKDDGLANNNPLPFAQASPDGSTAARNVLEPNGHLILAGEAGQDDTETLRQLFLRINTNLLNSVQTREASDSKKIFATELMDLIHQPARGSPVKEIRIHDYDVSWSGLAETVDFVGVCANLGQTIQPVPPKNVPLCDCCTLPRDRYLLAAHIASLERLAQLKGDCNRTMMPCKPWNFGGKALWSPGSLLFMRCTADLHPSVWTNAVDAESLVQRITTCKGKEKVEAVTAAGVNPAQMVPETGVVVFGGGGRTKRFSLKRPWSIH